MTAQRRNAVAVSGLALFAFPIIPGCCGTLGWRRRRPERRFKLYQVTYVIARQEHRAVVVPQTQEFRQ